MADEIITCTLVEESLNFTITEEPIKVTVEKGGIISDICDLLCSYLIIEDLTSQVVTGKTDFVTTQAFCPNTLKVYINGLKEGDISILSGNSFRLSSPIDNGDSVEVEFIKQIT